MCTYGAASDQSHTCTHTACAPGERRANLFIVHQRRRNRSLSNPTHAVRDHFLDTVAGTAIDTAIATLAEYS